MKIFQVISATGTQFAQSERERNNIIITNQVALLLGTLPLIYIMLNVYQLGWERITTPIVTQPFLFVIPVLLNYLGFTTVSRLTACWSMAVLALIFSIYNKSSGLDLETSHYMGIRFSILASAVIPFLLFELKQRLLLIIALLPTFIALISFDSIHQLFGVGYHAMGLNEPGYGLTTMRVMIAYLLIVGSSMFLKNRVEKNEALNLDLIRELTEKNNEIQAQLEEISQQHSQISFQNQTLEGQFKEITSQRDQLHQNETKLEKALTTIKTQQEVLVNQNKSLEFEVLAKNKELSQNNEQLVRYNNELQQFSYAVSHNLRGPVATIMGLIFLIEQENKGVVSPGFGHLRNTVRLLDETIQDLNRILDVRNAVTQVRQPIDLSSVFRKTTETFQKEIEQFNVRITENIQNRNQLISIQSLVNSIFYNLVSNAIKYRSRERIPEIQLTCFEDGNDFVIQVKDNGIGLDVQTNREKLFQLYKRFNAHTEGKGIGLYLVKLQAEILGGSVSVSSELDQYTEFTIRLPK